MIPKQGDILWISVEPHRGKEIGGHDKVNPYRPILVVSSNDYNKIGLIMGMPITSHNRVPGIFSEMLIPIHTLENNIHGYIIPFEIPCFDYRARSDFKQIKIVDHDSNEQNWQQINFYLKTIFKNNILK